MSTNRPTSQISAAVEAPSFRQGPRLPTLDRADWLLASGLGLTKLALHLGVLTRYGYHHDELYFLACGHHLDWGYVDHPPLVPWLARISSELFDPHPSPLAHFGLRLFASVSMALVVVAIALLARRMGGGRWAMAVGAGAWMLGPVALRTGNLFCIPAFEHLFWVLAAHAVLSAAEAGAPREGRRAWLSLGVVCGFGLLTKLSMLFFGLGILAAVLLVPALRHHLRSPWPYAGGAVALAIASPYLIWQLVHGWPTVEFLRAQSSAVESISRMQFVLGQLLYQGAGGALIWGAGLVFFLSPAGRRFRYFGWIYLTVFAFLLLAQSKIYYLSPAYPMLFAGGGVALGHLASRRRRPGLLRVAVPALVGIPALIFLPISLPLLPIDDTEVFIRKATFGAFENVYELTADLRG
ncbi:MAG: glycosyltransferase family 39 protein, partial [Holophagales bacterium]|nr:glycosyltransferase family 39 protein [Holophagales bacterium]